MWILRTANTNRKSDVNKLLKEGFEPFWGYRVPAVAGDKPSVKMYFKKDDFSDLKFKVGEIKTLPPQALKVKIEVDRTALDKLMQDVAIMAGTMMEAVENLRRIYESELSFNVNEEDAKKIEDLIKQDDREEDAMQNLDAIARNEDEDYLEPLNEDRDGLITERIDEFHSADLEEPPAGDSYRVVDEVPISVRVETNSLTTAQESVIKDLRENYSNITVYPVSKITGYVRVVSGTTIFEISPEGKTEKTDTNANISSV